MNFKNVHLLFIVVIITACTAAERKVKVANDSIVADSSGKAILKTDSITPATSLPDWAKALGLNEPRNMQLVPGMSQQTFAEEPSEGFNSVTLVYTGNYDTAMNQAARIAKIAKLPPSKEYKELKKQVTRAGHGNKLKGIAYMNYDLSTRDIDYLIYVQVDPKGMLTVSATDMKQMNKQLGKHMGIENRK
jgi:hypothetical protein